MHVWEVRTVVQLLDANLGNDRGHRTATMMAPLALLNLWDKPSRGTGTDL